MEITFDELVHTLENSGVLRDADVAELLVRLRNRPELNNCRQLADLLVSEEKLTSFQAEQLLLGNAELLHIDEYLLVDRIGAGGMGEVFKAKHRHMGRIVALKVLSNKVMDSDEAVRRFRREILAAARLVHPNVVTAYDAGQCEGLHYLVMEYVDGLDLRELVRAKSIDVYVAAHFALQAARGLMAAHEIGIIHRDIKPSNLLLDRSGRIKVLDLGIARLSPAHEESEVAVTKAPLTEDGVIMGTVDFMAPEQAANSENADERSDIYSLGCSLYFLLTRREVYSGKTIVQKIQAHHAHSLPSVRNFRSDVPPPLEAIVHRMIAKSPEHRFQRMNEVEAALTPFGVPAEDPQKLLQSAKIRLNGDGAGKSKQDAGTSETFARRTKTYRQDPADESAASLQRFIEGRGAVDQFLDDEEEQAIFRRAGDLGMTADQANRLLNEVCAQQGWRRHRNVHDAVEKIFSTQERIAKASFKQAVESCVALGMARRSAIEFCVTLMLDNQWRAEESDQDRWFTRKLEQLGLD